MTEIRCDVGIGIPTLNGPARVERCLKAIAAHTNLDAFGARLLLCDDGSRAEELVKNKAVASHYGVEILMNNARLGVAESWNHLTRHAVLNWDTSVMVLVNDDVEVVEDWLDALVFTVKENAWLGMVGLKAYNGVLSQTFRPPPTPSYVESTIERGEGLISSQGFCFAFSVAKYQEAGGFDPGYMAFYEEIDMGVSFLKRGYPSCMLSHPVVLHQGGATTSDPRNIDHRRALAESRARFNSKHGSVSQMRRLAAGVPDGRRVQWNTSIKVLRD